MENKSNGLKFVLCLASYLLVAVLASSLTFFLCDRWDIGSQPAAENQPAELSKLEELTELIEEYFVGETDLTAMQDGAANGMVAALGDRWSHYIPASEYEAYQEQMKKCLCGHRCDHLHRGRQPF